jgi:aspartyl-tRNA(Asn)/glutamyl-tRNA(Gln) amidotransferase subunit C
MSVTIADIEKLATLSRISLTPEEKEKMRGEFDSILEYVAAINKIAEHTEKDARSIVATVNVLREDTEPHESGIYTGTLLSAAPKREGNYVKVKKIL